MNGLCKSVQAGTHEESFKTSEVLLGAKGIRDFPKLQKNFPHAPWSYNFETDCGILDDWVSKAEVLLFI